MFMKTVRNLCFLVVLMLLVGACHSNDEKRGNWRKEQAFGGAGRIGAVSFKIGNAVYIGTGVNTNQVELKDFWAFNETLNWEEVDTLPAGAKARYGAVAFSDGKYGYVGLGYAANNNRYGTDQPEYFSDFYRFDPSAGRGSQWTKLGDFPGEQRRYATGFYVPSPNGSTGKGYVCFGSNNEGRNPKGSFKDWWEYDTQTDTWKQIGVYGDKREGACVAVVGSTAYIFTGVDDAGTYPTDFIKFTPFAGATSDTWWSLLDPLKDLDGRSYDNDYGMLPRAYAVSFVTGADSEATTRIHLATGSRLSLLSDCWEFNPYDHAEGRWNEVSNFPGGQLRQAGVGFTQNGFGWVTLGGANSSPSMNLSMRTSTYSFEPGVENWDQDDEW